MKTFQGAMLALLLGALPGCHRPATPPARPAGESARRFETRGLVREIAADRSRAVIRHEEIPGYMPRMTMELIVRNPDELDGISPGDEVTFALHATEQTHWIDSIQRVGRASETAVAAQPLFVPKELPELKPGDAMPDAEFLGEDGQPVRLSAYRGRALAFTFFFTRCPLPDYCPRMNSQFRDARAQLLERAPSVTNWQFLCVSFDAAFDKPAVLAGYAAAFRGDNRDRWRFAVASPETLAEVAPRLDLMVMREGTSLSHNLRTVVLDPAGRVFRQFDGNDWTADELASAVLAAARQGVEVEGSPPAPPSGAN